MIIYVENPLKLILKIVIELNEFRKVIGYDDQYTYIDYKKNQLQFYTQLETDI